MNYFWKTVRDKPLKRRFGCTLYLHNHEEKRALKFANQAQVGLCFGMKYGLLITYVKKHSQAVETSTVTSHETWYRHQQKQAYVSLSEPSDHLETILSDHEKVKAHCRKVDK